MASPIPSTQKAWYIVRSGVPAKALVLVDNIPVPTKVPPSQMLVKIQAAALNPADYRLMRMFPGSLTKRVAGYSFSGTVADSNDSSEFKVGDPVFGMINPFHSLRNGQGTLTSYALVPQNNTVHTPSNVSQIEAAGFVGVGYVAFHLLFKLGELEEGQNVFINGGSTSVGAFAIQIAKAYGCRVTASASGKNEELVRSLGADEFFDYTVAPLHEQLLKTPPTTKYNIFFDAVGLGDPSLYIHSESYLAPNGIFLSTGPKPTGVLSALQGFWHFYLRPRWAGGTNRPFRWISVQQIDNTALKTFQNLIAEGKVKPVIDSIWKFEDVLQAFEKLMTGRARGKIIIEAPSS